MSIDGKELLSFQVTMALEAVMVEGNGFPYRVDDRVIKEPQEVMDAREQT